MQDFGIHSLYGLRDMNIWYVYASLGEIELPARTIRLEARRKMGSYTLRSRFALRLQATDSGYGSSFPRCDEGDCARRGSLLRFGTGDRGRHIERQLRFSCEFLVSGIPTRLNMTTSPPQHILDESYIAIHQRKRSGARSTRMYSWCSRRNWRYSFRKYWTQGHLNWFIWTLWYWCGSSVTGHT